MSTVGDNLRLALRGMRHRPLFAGTVVATLAIGIGATAAAFALVQAALATNRTVRDPGQLVVLRTLNRADPSGTPGDVPWDTQTLLRNERTTFADVAATLSGDPYPLAGLYGDRIFQFTFTLVSGNFFDVLGLRPELGRLLSPQDDVHGASPVVVLSDELWRSAFAGDSAVIGKVLLYGGDRHRVIGVAPPTFSYPTGTDIWAAAAPALTNDSSNSTISDYNGFYLVARLRPGASHSAAQAALGSVLRADSAQGTHKGFATTGRVTPYTDVALGASSRPTIILLFATVGLVLIVACANVAGLLLGRGIARQSEFVVRSALGASQAQLVGHVLAESALLGVIGGALGIGVSTVLVRAAIALAPRRPAMGFSAMLVAPSQPIITTAQVDLRVVMFAAVITIMTIVGFGLVPALRSSRLNSYGILGSTTRSVTQTRATSFGRRVLVGAQIALAVVVLSGAALIGRTLGHLERVSLGFNPDHLLFFRLAYMIPAVPHEDYWHVRAAFVDALSKRVPTVPGLGPMTSTYALPFSGEVPLLRYLSDGEAPRVGVTARVARVDVALDDYFGVLGIPVLRGRPFGPLDDAHSPFVAAVNEAFARQAWPGQDPIGHRIRFLSDSGERWRTVVAVVRDARYDDPSTAASPAAYVSGRQTPLQQSPWYIVRTTGPLSQAVHVLTSTMTDVDAAFGVSRTATGPELLADRLARPRAFAALFSALSATTLLLAAIGLFGVLAAYVRERHREIAIRSALGATAAQVRARVLQQVLGAVVGGVGCGVPLALVGAGVLRATVSDVRSLDAMTMLLTVLVLLVTALAATYGPMLYAIRIDVRAALNAD